jgi:hypothetical protein
MRVACAAEVCRRYLWEVDTSNKPFEWTGHQRLSAAPPQIPCLPLRGSVGPSRYAADSRIKHSISPRATGCKAKDA